MPAVPTISASDLGNLRAASFQRVQQGTTLIINLPPAVSRVTSSSELTGENGVNTRRALRAAEIRAENQERAAQAAAAAPPLPAPTPIAEPAPIELTAQGYAYQVRADLGGGFPDNLRLNVTPPYAAVPDLNNPVPDLDSKDRRWQLLWSPREDQCSSEVNPYERLWQFTITFVSDLGPEYATPIHFNLIAQSRSLITAGAEGARGSSYGGPPETKYGEYRHWPLPWYKVDDGELDIESAMGVHYFEQPSVGRRVFDFAQPNGALNRQVFDLEPGDYTTEDFGGEEPTALPEESKYLITDVELYIDFSGETMSWKGIEYIAAPDVSDVLRVEPLGIDRLGGYFGQGLVSAGGRLFAPWGRTPDQRAKRMYEIDLERKEIKAGPGPLGEVANAFGSYNAIGVLSDGRIYWSSERVRGRVAWSMAADLSDAPGVGSFGRNHGRFNWQGPNGLNGVGAIRYVGPQVLSGQGIMSGIASDGTRNWGITPSVQGSNGDGTWFDYNPGWNFLLNLNATARTYQNPRAWRLRIDFVNLEKPTGLAWYRGRLVLTDEHEDSNSTTLHVVNQYSGQVFPASATIEGVRIGGLDVMDGRLLGISDEDVYWLGAWSAENAAPSGLRFQVSSTTSDGCVIYINHQFGLYDGYAYELKQAAGASESLYSDAAPLNSPIAARRGYASWGPVHAAPATGARSNEITIKGGKANTTYTLEGRNVFLPNNADSDWDYSVAEDKRIGIPGPPGAPRTFTTAPAAAVVEQDFGSTTESTWAAKVTVDYPTDGVAFFYKLGSSAAAAASATRTLIRRGAGAGRSFDISGQFTRTGQVYDEFSYIIIEAQSANGTARSSAVPLVARMPVPTRLGGTAPYHPYITKSTTSMGITWRTPGFARYPNVVLEVAVVSWGDFIDSLDPAPENASPATIAALGRKATYNDILTLIGDATTSKHAGTNPWTPGVPDQTVNVTGLAAGQPYFICIRALSRNAEPRAQSDWIIYAYATNPAIPAAPSVSVSSYGPASSSQTGARGTQLTVSGRVPSSSNFEIAEDATFPSGAISTAVNTGRGVARYSYSGGVLQLVGVSLTQDDGLQPRGNTASSVYRIRATGYGSLIDDHDLVETDGGLLSGAWSPASSRITYPPATG